MTKPFVLLIILLALASLSYGDSPSILYFDSVSGTYGGHSYAAESYYGPYYVSPYFGHVDNNPVGSEVLFCIDFDHYINVPDQTPAVFRSLPTTGFQDSNYQFENVTNGGNPGDFINGSLPTGANISDLSAYQRYEAAIYLLNQDLTAPGLPVQNSQLRADYQYAMWALFLQNGPPDGATVYTSAIATIDGNDAGFGADVNALIIAAYNQVKTNEASVQALFSSYQVVDASGNPAPIGSKYQEFLTPISGHAGLNPTPEPASLVFFGTVVAGLGLIFRRRAA